MAESAILISHMNSDKEKNKTRGRYNPKYVSGSNAIRQKLALNQKSLK